MDLIAARAAALALMQTHGVTSIGWTFRFDRATMRLGFCNYGTRTLSMGTVFVLAADTVAVTQTMLHEIAHVHAGVEHGHDRVWKDAARTIGYTGHRTAKNPAYEAQQAAQLAFAHAVAPARAGIRSGPLQIGERVISLDERYSGLIVTIGQTRCRLFSAQYDSLVNIRLVALRRANLPANAPPNLPARDPDIAVGDRIVSRDRAETGIVMKIARTRFHFRSDRDGQLYGIAFADATALRAGAAGATLAPRTTRVAALPLRVADRIVTRSPGSTFDGLHGTIVSVGAKNLRVVLDDARLIIASAGMLRRE
ncbi:MAG: hypothetical protein R6W83_01525 [Cryobacterium sp.]